MSAERGILTRRAAIASVTVAAILVSAKFWATLQTGSAAMLGSLADSALDLTASIVTLIAVRVAAEPPDADHRFGHDKAEALAALFQTLLVGASGILVAFTSIRRFARPQTVVEPDLGISVSVLAIVLTLALVIYQRSVVSRTKSVAIQSDSLHYQADMLLNVAVILALVLDAVAGLTGTDAVFGLGIAAWLGWNGYRNGQRAVDMLMDREWPELRRQQLLNIVAAHPDVEGIHELKTRRAGAREFAQFHIWVDPELSVSQASQIVKRIEGVVESQFPQAEVLIHVDPRGQLEEHEIEEVTQWEAGIVSNR